ncbi:hypothetical protein ACFZC5_27905 [Nocardia gamkensis]|uniref:hypothetical protein n=1 Tax=Nocardia gamkensis TaxID=352869 RepID=UPI0036EFE7BD
MTDDTLIPVVPSFALATVGGGLDTMPGVPGLPLGNVEQPPQRDACELFDVQAVVSPKGGSRSSKG